MTTVPDKDNAAAPPAKLDASGRRSRLRQYQVQLLERMQAARVDTGKRTGELGVQIGDGRYLLDLTQAGEIVPFAPVVAVPLTQPWYLGLANLRGSLVGVIDYARFIDAGSTVPGPDSRIVTFSTSLGFNCALLVSRVVGLRHAGDMEQVGARLRDVDANEWQSLDLAALCQDPRFLHIGL
jgi:twitching motility protein PilI